MSKTLVGICAYGGLPFLKLGLTALREQQGEKPFDIFVVVGKPNDQEMIKYLLDSQPNVGFKVPAINEGFPAAVNDLYDAAFVRGDYDNLIIMGNDVIPMPGTIKAMIDCADTTDYEMVCGSEFNARFLVDHYPEVRKFFHGDNLIFQDWGARPWLLHKDHQNGVEPDTRKDIRNLTLFKRSSFEKVGYDDVSFWPNGYYADNDYGRRCDLLGVSACGLKEAAFFHFTSRTIHQSVSRDHGGYFERNKQHYIAKWGGEPGQEKWNTPSNRTALKLKIDSREHEAAVINHWSKL